MLKKLICVLMLSCVSGAYSLNQTIPQTIDLGQIDITAIPGYDSMNWDEIAEECQPFNAAIEFGPYFNYLKNAYLIERAVETGTWQGETTKCLGILFDKVHTMEIQVDVFEQALVTLQPYPNVEVHYGNSPDILRQILPGLKGKRSFFYLDAHWFSNWPLLTELEIISKTHRDNCIIVIDDFKVPERNDIPYDAYGVHECSYQYIKPMLSRIFSSYVCYYVIPKSVNARAKFVAIPQKWVSESGSLYSMNSIN